MTCGPAEHVAWEKKIRFRGCGAGGSPRNRVGGGWPSRRRRLARALASDATGTAVANDRAVTPSGDRPVVPEATGPAVADYMMGDASHPQLYPRVVRGCGRPVVSEATGPAVADDMTALTPSPFREFSSFFRPIVPETTVQCFERMMGRQLGCLFARCLVTILLIFVTFAARLGCPGPPFSNPKHSSIILGAISHCLGPPGCQNSVFVICVQAGGALFAGARLPREEAMG